MKVSWVWEMIGKTFGDLNISKFKFHIAMLIMVSFEVVIVYMPYFESTSLRNILEETQSEHLEGRKHSPFISKNTIIHENDEVPEEKNPCETGNSIIDDMQAKVKEPSENGNKVSKKLKLFLMVKSPTISAMVRLALVKGAGLFHQ